MKVHDSKQRFALYFRNFIFGVEDSLVSTVGLLSGVAIADVPRATIFLTGMVLIFVEGFSMGVGSFLSEQSSEDLIHKKNKDKIFMIKASVIMFFSYFFAGFIPLFPYMILETKIALPVSISLAIITLFVLGIIAGKVSHKSYIKSAMRMMIVGGVAIGLGVLVGSIINQASFVG